MRLFRLIVHQKTFSEEDLLINPKDYQEAKEGDIVEIYDPSEEDNPRLLLQIKAFKDDLTTKDAISIEQSIATAFGLRPYKDVSIRIVDPSDVTLDSIELTFKDQYMGRSEMWRLKNSLINTCVYMNKKLEFCGGAVRCQVYEMWSQGDRVACGVITDDTKVVFRSSTSMVYLFLQMSSEMWDFDIYGDLYFEKAVNGFLSDLFMKWKKNGSNHEVTIVLFSRTFYNAKHLEEFPLHMRECLQEDYKGRYYEDFYRVVVQNEKYDDWSGILVQLRKVFSEYLKTVLEYHSRQGQIIPTATNSTAAQGNFLEVLNMSLNVFEKHYLDRSFDRTGQLSVVVTPGVGVFEVDRELTNITKQRIIDNGVGSDLVCVGEQPLHAVPLLKFHNKDTHLNVPDDYSMPHWINLSFYSTNKKIAYSNFIPRIKLPPSVIEDCSEKCIQAPKTNFVSEEDYIHNSFFDYDAYDAQVFQIPPVHPLHETSVHKTTIRYKRSSGGLLDSQELNSHRRKLSDPDIQHTHPSENLQRSQPIMIPPAATSPIVSPHEEKSLAATLDRELSPPLRMVIGSEGSPPLESRALINPFDPSHVTIKLTSNRRRWTHIFPKGPTGVLIQQHHYQAVPTKSQQWMENELESCDSKLNKASSLAPNELSTTALHEYCKKDKRIVHVSNQRRRIPLLPKNPSKSLTFLWGATGEQEWTPALTTVNEVLIGVDWKSLTIPACLPITTDYFPDNRALQMDYVHSLYSLLPDDVNADVAQQKVISKKPLTTLEVFNELISQRLAQGFQLVLLPNTRENSSSVLGKCTPDGEQTYILSIGRLFHKITLAGNNIIVTRYRPRHPYPGFKYEYRYRFHAPHHDTYEESYALFTTEKLEHYNWNYLDHYICTRGDSEFVLVDALKYWRFRVYLLPLLPPKKVGEGSQRYDIYGASNLSDSQQISEGFLKFTETIVNKIKRPGAIKKPRNSTTRSAERYIAPALRSGSKVMERGRGSPAIEVLQQQNNENQTLDNSNEENIVPDPLLRALAPYAEILDAMKHSIHGVGFITTHQSLPQYTFISSDAVSWLITHMEGIISVEEATKIFLNMQRENLIRHASGESTKPFLYGFFLYYIVQPSKPTSAEDKDRPFCDIQNFEYEWMEVEIRPLLNWGLATSTTALNVSSGTHEREHGVPHFLCEDIDPSYLQGDIEYPMYKRMHLDIDVSNKSDRVEWGHVRYQTVFRPDQAYEFVLEWLTASGSIVAELLLGWARKAQACGLQMIPIPHDPLALPYSNKSDPLRGPIFIPLNTKCLEGHDGLFKEFDEDSNMDRLFLFQEAIICRFGFIPCLVEPPNSGAVSQEHQYIHCTGTVFILVSSSTAKPRNRLASVSRNKSVGRYSVHADVVPSPHEAYITRHVSGKNKDDYDNTRKMGFLWSWNHMISKRWRSNQPVDNVFQTKLLKDFREFCANSDNRLRSLWDKCWEAKEVASTNSKSLVNSNI